MPNSFIQTGGFDTQIYPNTQFQPVSAFGNPGESMARGIVAGSGIAAQQAQLALEQRGQDIQQQQAAAIQRRLMAMAPIEQQQLALSNQEKKRQLSIPPLIPIGETIQPVVRNQDKVGGQIDQDAYQENLKNGMPDEQAKAMATKAGEDPIYDQYKVKTMRNALTGQVTQIPELYKTAEDIKKEEAMAALYGFRGELAQAQATEQPGKTAALFDRANRKEVSSIDEDGNPFPDGAHLVHRTMDPQTGEVKTVDLGRADLEIAKINHLNAQATRQGTLSELDKKRTSTTTKRSSAVEAIDAKNADAYGIHDPEVFRRLSRMGAVGRAALNESRAQIVQINGGVLTPPPLSTFTQRLIDQTQAKVDQERDAEGNSEGDSTQVDGIGHPITVSSDQGVSVNIAGQTQQNPVGSAKPAGKFIPGHVYTDASGKKARYNEGGSWTDVK